MNVVLAAFGIAIAVVVLPIVLTVLWLLLYDYRITDSTIEVMLFHLIPIYRIRFSDIRTAYSSTWFRIYMGRLNILFLPNRFFVKKVVIIEKWKGIVHRILITPDDPDEFLRRIHKIIEVK